LRLKNQPSHPKHRIQHPTSINRKQAIECYSVTQSLMKQKHTTQSGLQNQHRNPSDNILRNQTQ
jgi:hypothetical protein